MIQQLHRVVQLIEGAWSNTRILVLGDVMLDRYIWGEVARISPEAPVPIVRAGHQSERPGGAANVAMNIAGLGGKAMVAGFIGNDPDGASLLKLLGAAAVESRMHPVPGCPTTSKLRVLCGRQQMLRLDTEETEGYPAQSCRALSETIASAITSVNAVVLSDYAKGVLSEDVARLAIREARARDIPVLVDPKRRSFERYYGATIICPNLAELGVAAGTDGQNLDAVLTAGQQLCSQLSLDCIAVTLSEKGIAVLRPGSRFVAPAVARQVFDVSGAGDTVIATLAMAMANQVDIETAVQIANIAAGIVVSKVGTVPVTRDELLVQLMPDIELRAEEKVLSLEQLKVRASAWRSAGQAIAFTNGCFDLLHLGHITLLEEARRQGDRLIVAINSDSSVRQLKGPSRPIVCERDRARILAALAAVDAVVVFQEATPLRLIEELRPDIIVKGGDYREESIVGAREVRSWGGRIKIVPTVEGFSTTSLIARFTAPAN